MPNKSSTMTNRSKQGDRATGGRGLQKQMRFLDLSFEGREQARVQSISNGFRPHGGYRGTSGKHPPALHSFNKPVDYQKQLQDDLDKLFHDEKMSRCNSPAWAFEVSQEKNNSGESPLFINKLLSPSRIDQQFDSVALQSSRSQKKKEDAPPTKNGVRYYRPNKTHQYLTKTELKDCTSSEVDVKLGKPTRTTLLRARQRCNSAPINGYEARREQMKRLEKKEEYRRSKRPLTIRDLLGESAPDSESLHSFLIGARYNRAHYLDAKSLTEHGVYMPRNNPLGCFVVKRNIPRPDSASGIPAAPPDSPVSIMSDDEDDESYRARSPGLPPQPPSTPSKGHRQAWDDANKVEVNISPDDTVPLSDRQNGDDRKASHSMPIIEQIMNLEDGLNIKGKNFSNVRPKSARSHGNQHLPYTNSRPSSAHPSLPAVSIQGHSINKLAPKLGARDAATDQTTMANNPPPPNTPHQLGPDPQETDNRLTPKTPGGPVPSQEPEEQGEGAVKNEETAPAEDKQAGEDEPQQAPEAPGQPSPAEEKAENVPVEKVDIGINCPSVPSVAGDAAKAASATQEENKPDPEKSADDPEASITDTGAAGDAEPGEEEEDKAGEPWPGGEDRPEVEKKVRFADDVQTSDNAVFFMTEEEQEETVAGNKDVQSVDSGNDNSSANFSTSPQASIDGTGEGSVKADDSAKSQVSAETEGVSPDPQAGEDEASPSEGNTGASIDNDDTRSPSADVVNPEDPVSEDSSEIKQEISEKDDNASDASENAAEDNCDTNGDEETEAPPVISIDISPKPMSPAPTPEQRNVSEEDS